MRVRSSWRTFVALLGLALAWGRASYAAEPAAVAQATAPAAGLNAVTQDWVQSEPLGLAAFSEEKANRLIAAVYARLVELVRASGRDDFELQLSQFETVPAAEMGRVLWRAVVDLPEGRVVDVAPHADTYERNRGGNRSVVRRVEYQASWRSVAAAWQQAPWAGALERLSVQEALDQASIQRPQLTGAVALTSYLASVSFAGEARLYRASFVWVPNPAEGSLTFYVLDTIVQGVEEAAREPLPARTADDGKEPLRRLNRLAQRDLDARCYETVTNPSATSSEYRQGFNDHLAGGYHYSQASFRQICSCDYYCNQTCSTSIQSSTCADVGLTDDYCHMLASSSATGQQTVANGHLSPASCGAGFGCVERDCTFCGICSVGVSVNGGGPTISISPTTPVSWDGSQVFSRACTPCSVIPVDDPNSNGGNNNGGNNGGGTGGGGVHSPQVEELSPFCDSDHDGWVTPAECVALCGGSVNGQWCDV